MKLLPMVGLLLLSEVAMTGNARTGVLEAASKAAEEGAPKSMAESVGRTLQFTEDSFLTVAEAMPENKYSFVPSAGNFEGVRSFAEQVKHVACAQFAFFNE